MSTKTSRTVILLGATALLLAPGCSQPKPDYGRLQSLPAPTGSAQMETVTNAIDAELLRAPTNLFTLGPGDKLDIELLQDQPSKITTVVGPDGKIYFNLLPGIDVWGLTLGQVREQLQQGLAKYIRGSPQVNVTLRDVQSRRVWLLGRFQSPGVYTMPGPMTVLEAVTMAGGAMTFTGTREVTGGPLGEDLADLRHSFIVRNGQFLPVDFDRLLNKGDLSQNIYLQPDDFVYFAPAYTREVYVLGAVVQPKPVPYTDGMTVGMAIAGSYGIVRDAYQYHVMVIRGSLAQPEAAVVDYRAIVEGRAHDIPVQPGDIIYVPFTPYRYFRKYIEIALNTFVSSVAINAGVSAVAKRGTTSGGVVIPVGSTIQVIPPSAPPIH